MKLELMIIPRSTAGVNARSLCTKEQWDRARFACYRRAGYVCEACGGIGDEHPVECHECWEWNLETRTQKLVKLVALCPTCHQAVHIRGTVNQLGTRVAAQATYEALCDHIADVNHWSPIIARTFVDLSVRGALARDNIAWVVDVSLVRDFVENIPKFELNGYEI